MALREYQGDGSPHSQDCGHPDIELIVCLPYGYGAFVSKTVGELYDDVQVVLDATPGTGQFGPDQWMFAGRVETIRPHDVTPVPVTLHFAIPPTPSFLNK